MNKDCLVCGISFKVEPRHYEKRKTCGNKECNKIHRSRKMSGAGNHQHGLRGELNASFKGGRRIGSKGYVRVLMPEHPNADAQGYVKEHILVMSQILGRPIDTKNGEMVHHKDEDKTNNAPGNLELMSKGAHTTMHNLENPMPRGGDGKFIMKGV